MNTKLFDNLNNGIGGYLINKYQNIYTTTKTLNRNN